MADGYCGDIWARVEASKTKAAETLRIARRGLYYKHADACYRDAYASEDYWSSYRQRLTRIVKRSRNSAEALRTLKRTMKRWPADVIEAMALAR